MILAHVERPRSARRTQKHLSRERFRTPGAHPGPRPGPGVYATADSVATPALLPDGSTADGSVSSTVERAILDSGTKAAK
jgi:NADH-quinone oxidoreductase subunit J